MILYIEYIMNKFIYKNNVYFLFPHNTLRKLFKSIPPCSISLKKLNSKLGFMSDFVILKLTPDVELIGV